ncbi:DUF397 domain-containing protein [Streptomyces sp. NPDC050732]
MVTEFRKSSHRDSKNPAGPTLIFRPETWDGFVAGIKSVNTR